MQKIKIRLPATISNLGPGYSSLGLAIGLYVTVEISESSDNTVTVDYRGEGAGSYTTILRHPVILGMSYVFFQRLEHAALGYSIRIDNQIPPGSGLGAETVMMVAGALGANFLMRNRFNRAELLEIIASITDRESAVTAMLGGLTATAMDGSTLIHLALPVTQMTVVVVTPQLESYSPSSLSDRVPLNDVVFNLTRIPLLLEALRGGDLKMLARSLEDRLYMPHLVENITGFSHVVETALSTGAAAVTVSGDGPSLIAFADSHHERLAEEMCVAFENVGVYARSWVLPVDTQGVVISAMQST